MSVYFMQMGDGGPIKIGHAKDVYKRRSVLQMASTTEIKILSYTDGGAPEEATLHQRFAHLRVRGEFFRPGAELLSHIAALPPVPERTRRFNGGRPKLWPVRLTLPLTDETVERLDAVRADDESRLDVIREGIERELKRRERCGKGAK